MKGISIRKSLLVTSVTTAISLVNIANADTNGTVTFSGKLNDQTCQVTLNDGTSGSGTVVLPSVSRVAIENDGEGGSTPFTLKLTGCKASDTAFGVTAYFLNNSNISGIYLINKDTGPDAASGVRLQISQKINGSKIVVPLGWSIIHYNHFYQTIDANSTSGTLEYSVQYSRGSYSVKAGKFTGIAIYELVYK